MRDRYDYDDILRLPHPISEKHAPLPPEARAAQFASFKALAGFEEEITEEGRLTDTETEAADDRAEELDRRLRRLLELRDAAPEAEFVWFVPDGKKTGGSYRRSRGRIRKLDPIGRTLLLSGGERVPLDALTGIET